ncbi:hypothetical protein IG631_22466 [Alternaria alternata]|nr:hypothetical protein IG631_22466 [Alternaria alternata]
MCTEQVHVQDTNFLLDTPSMDSVHEPPPKYEILPSSISSRPDAYCFLQSVKTVFLIDDCGSMSHRLWEETGKALEMLLQFFIESGSDGVDIYFLNHPDSSHYKNVTSAGTFMEIFHAVQPSGGTPTGQRLNNILESYLQRFEEDNTIKPMNIIAIMDEVPSDDVESVVTSATGRLDALRADPRQIGIQFFEVGKQCSALEPIQKLHDRFPDMVDAISCPGEGQAGLTSEVNAMDSIIGR